MNYRNSPLRKNILLALFTIIMYNISISEDSDSVILGLMVLGIWILAANDWRKS